MACGSSRGSGTGTTGEAHHVWSLAVECETCQPHAIRLDVRLEPWLLSKRIRSQTSFLFGAAVCTFCQSLWAEKKHGILCRIVFFLSSTDTNSIRLPVGRLGGGCRQGKCPANNSACVNRYVLVARGQGHVHLSAGSTGTVVRFPWTVWSGDGASTVVSLGNCCRGKRFTKTRSGLRASTSHVTLPKESDDVHCPDGTATMKKRSEPRKALGESTITGTSITGRAARGGLSTARGTGTSRE